MINQQNKLIVFQDKNIRRAWHEEQWFYSLVDVIGALTGSSNPTDYLKKIRKRDEELGFYIGPSCPQIEMVTQSGKERDPERIRAKCGFRKQLFRHEEKQGIG